MRRLRTCIISHLVMESPSQRNPQSSSVERLQQILYGLVYATERDEEGLIYMANKKMTHTCKSLQTITPSSAHICTLWPVLSWYNNIISRSLHTHTQKTTLPNKTFWNKHVTNNNNSRGCLRTPSCAITHLPVPRTCSGGKWAKKSDCLVSFGNTSQHSTAYRSELHSENKHFKSCWPVVWPKALTREWIQAFYNAALWCCQFGIILTHLLYSDHREIFILGSYWCCLLLSFFSFTCASRRNYFKTPRSNLRE